MSEEWGEIIIKAPAKINAAFVAGDYIQGFTKLAEFSGIDATAIGNFYINNAEVNYKKHYLYLSYECAELSHLSSIFVSQGKNIEYYARHGDEYGTMNFYALSINNKLSLQFDDGGEAFEDEDYQKQTINTLEKWKLLIPKEVKELFPDFANIDPNEYIY
jgi:hypothetical protein